MSDLKQRHVGASTSQTKSTPTLTAFRPLYKQIKELILQSLKQGEWKPGESIPSELELADRFQVSQGTVRKAIDELAAENVLLRRQGKGTFVTTHNEAEVRYRFLRLTPIQANTQQSRGQSRFLSCELKSATAKESELLGLARSEKVLCIRRVMTLSQKPTVIEDIVLPAQSFAGLDLNMLNKKQEPLYSLFETRFSINMIRAEEKVSAIGATPEVAKLLNVDQGQPLLSVERVSFTYGDRPVEIRNALYLTQDYYYRNSLN